MGASYRANRTSGIRIERSHFDNGEYRVLVCKMVQFVRGFYLFKESVMAVFALVIALGASTLAQPTPAAQPSAAPASSPAAATGPYRVLNTFNVGGEGAWDYLCLDADGTRLFVPRSTHTMVLDTKTGKTLGDIPDTQGVHGVALAPEFGKGFTSNGRAGTVTVFDLKEYKALDTVKVGENPDSILFEPTTKRVFTFNGRSKDSSVVDAATLKVLETIPLGGKPEFCVADGAGKIFANMEDTSELVRIDAKTMKVEARWKLAPGQEPSGLAIDPVHKRLFSVCSNEKMIVVDAESGKVLANPAIGKGVDGAGFDPAGFAFASNGDGTMTVVSTKDDKFDVAQTLPTAPRARTCAVDPKTRMVYLPTAEFEPAPPAKEGARPQRPTMKPGTFKIVVVAPK
jgi:YVTN family beta-propeller protein